MMNGKTEEPFLTQAFTDSKLFLNIAIHLYYWSLNYLFIYLFSVLVTFVDHFNQIVDTLSEKLRSKADNKTVICLLNEINRATLDAIAIVSSRLNH